MSQSDDKLEREYLEKTIKIIKKIIKNNEKEIKDNDEECKKIREYVWKNISELDGGELSFFRNEILLKNNITNINYLNNLVLKDMQNNPYYARVDFKEDGKEILAVNVGLNSVMDENLNIYVYDWRTPIASLYYDYEIGKAKYCSPKGVVSGDLLLKRQYKIEKGKLIYFIDNSLSISDDFLLEVLNRNSTDNMKQIVSTIQKEQNEVIRNYKDRVLIVEGPAGCGKTSVALHHVAFLLYNNRDFLTADNILIFSPNEIFSNYISEVLPSLGERNVLQTEFSKYIKVYLDDFKNIESYEKYLERLNNEEQDLSDIVIKMSKYIAKAIENYVLKLNNEVIWQDVVVDGEVVVSRQECYEVMNEKYNGWPLFKKIRKTIEYIFMKIRHQKGLRKINNEIQKYVESRVVYCDNFLEIASRMIEDEDFNQDIYNLTGRKLSNNKGFSSDKINYEDAIILLYLKGLLYGFGYDNSIKQVVIDEAQDYSYMQLEILKKIFKDAFFTILGDSNQQLNICLNNDFNDVNLIFKEYFCKRISLKTTYRSSCEITNYCNNILGLKNVNPINRHNKEPLEVSLDNDFDVVDWINKYLVEERKYSFNKIAIITKNKKANDFIKKNLVKYENVDILPVYNAKGLEYDSVIVINESLDVNYLYVACSRALHHLVVLNI